MTIRAVLFDFDGTLADSFDAITASTNHVRTSCGLPELPDAEVRTFVGHGLYHLMKTLVPNLPTEEAIQRYREHHARVMLTHTKLFPGVLETLKILHAHGLKMAVCSNKTVAFTKKLVQALGLAEYLPLVLGPEDVGVPKPDPAMLLEACQRCGVSQSEAVYVGDMSVDVKAGKAAGLPVWLVHVGLAGSEDPRRLGPDRVLKEFSELQELAADSPTR